MGLHGNLATMSLGDILGWINMGKKEGILTVNSELETKMLFLRDGNLVYALSNSYTERLASVLVKRNLVNETQCGEVLAEQHATDREFGLALLDRGMVTVSGLSAAVRELVESVFFSLFAWTGGVFLYVDASIPVAELWPEQFVLTNMIMEGARHADELKKAKQEMARYSAASFRISKEKRKQFQGVLPSLGMPTIEFCRLMKEGRTLDDIVHLSTCGELATLQAVKKLLDEKWIQAGRRPEMPAETKVADLVSRGDTLYAQERLADAIESWRQVLELDPAHECANKLEKARKRYLERIRNTIGDEHTVPCIRPEVEQVKPQNLFVPEFYHPLFLAIDGKQSLRQLAEVTGLALEDVYMGIHRLAVMEYAVWNEKVTRKVSSPFLRQ
jgi:tetratricopeptide (TPR) repeat protein